jgi:hypothetical protein
VQKVHDHLNVEIGSDEVKFTLHDVGKALRELYGQSTTADEGPSSLQ